MKSSERVKKVIRRSLIMASFFAIASLFVGCGGGNSNPPEAKITFFRASQSSINSGEEVSLSWEASSASTSEKYPTGCALSANSEGDKPLESLINVACTAAQTKKPDVTTIYQLNVLKANQAWQTADVRVEVQIPSNQTPNAAFTSSVNSGEAPLSVSFDASSSSDSDGTISAYNWSFGDGTTATGKTTTHTFTSSGTFKVTLTVTDSGGETDTKEQTIVVNEPSKGCVAKVAIVDAALETAIRAELGKPTGILTCEDMASLTSVTADAQGIKSLAGLELAINLVNLRIEDNDISDISPLAGLTKLNSLRLHKNVISDITALENLTNLTLLYLGQNQLVSSDLATVAKLTKLTDLGLGGNKITDISALSPLTNLRKIFLFDNGLTSIEVLSTMTFLQELTLPFNLISDISPLVNNTGIGSGDSIQLNDNCLDLTAGSEDSTNINILVGRGASVTFTPQKASCS